MLFIFYAKVRKTQEKIEKSFFKFSNKRGSANISSKMLLLTNKLLSTN